ncbi:IS110 family transposase [Nonomuraea turkmeniaca]|uniref:IS110 family transposase n=1 Tax=Nonomuraea turkmeniaca TaxID=103838 RepID=A0A5S4FMK1_9ACTN|nr:IS110 family transposase [Nonomuraea turkmeniaca]
MRHHSSGCPPLFAPHHHAGLFCGIYPAGPNFPQISREKVFHDRQVGHKPVRILLRLITDMGRFPTAAHLASWARIAPMTRESAGKSRRATTGKGNSYLAAVLGEAVIGAPKAVSAVIPPDRQTPRHRRGLAHPADYHLGTAQRPRRRRYQRITSL